MTWALLHTLLHYWHYFGDTYLETLQEHRSHRRIGWIIQEFRETCVSRSLTFRLKTKMPWRQTPSRKKKDVVFTTDDERLSGSTKHLIFKSMWNIFKVCGIESLKYFWEFYTPVCYCGYIATWHKTKHDWLLYLSVIWPLGRALAIQSGQSSGWRSVYARLTI